MNTDNKIQEIYNSLDDEHSSLIEEIEKYFIFNEKYISGDYDVIDGLKKMDAMKEHICKNIMNF